MIILQTGCQIVVSQRTSGCKLGICKCSVQVYTKLLHSFQLVSILTLIYVFLVNFILGEYNRTFRLSIKEKHYQ